MCPSTHRLICDVMIITQTHTHLSALSSCLQGALPSKPTHTLIPLPHFLHDVFLTAAVLTNESTVTFKNESDGRNVELDVRGTWYDRSASVTFGGEPVAHISRSIFNMREILADKDTVSRSLVRVVGSGK